MKRTGLMLLPTLLALVMLTACGDGQQAREPERAPGANEATAGAPVDTSELGRIYGAINADHQQLMTRYQQMAGQMGADVRQMYDYMAQMHGRATQMHREMMGPSGGGMMDGEMMDRGMMRRDMQGRGVRGGRMMMQRQTREWDLQMWAMHQQMSQHMREQGYDEMAALHDQMMAYYGEAAGGLSEGEGAAAPPPPPEGTVSGAEIYRQYCATCHGDAGQGLGSAFPPLAGSEWVTDDAETPIRIVLHGLQGQIQVQDRTFDGVMPAFGARLSDEEVAALLTYVRSRWGNDASAVTAGTVREVREESEGRVQPWTPATVR